MIPMRDHPRPGAPKVPSPPALTETLRDLQDRSIEELRAEWRRLYRAEAPACFSRDLLLRSIAHRLQEAAFGGLPSATRRQLKKLATATPEDHSRNTVTAPARVKPGAVLIREWHGQTHTVVVQDEGFEHQGKRYASLSEVARLITGAHWSGPRFFGLRRAANGQTRGAAARSAPGESHHG